jgi:guanylate kinase
MAAARAEIAHWAEFDDVLVNQDLDATVAATRTVLHAARLARHRQRWLDGFVETLRADGG